MSTARHARRTSIVDQSAARSSAVHHAGVVHRYIKPGNLLLDDEGNVDLSDFGIALGPSQPGRRRRRSPFRRVACLREPEQMTGQTIMRRPEIYPLGARIFEL